MKTNMEYIATDLRLILNKEDEDKLSSDPRFIFKTSRDGYYKYQGKIYKYFGSMMYVDYFVELSEPLLLGIKLN